MRIIVFLLFFMFSLSAMATGAGCVTNSAGNSICTDANGNIISGGTTATGGAVTTNCVTNSAGNSICTDSNGNIVSGGTNGNGTPTAQQNCVFDSTGKQICTSSTGSTPTPTPTPTPATVGGVGGDGGADGSGGVGGKGGTGGTGGAAGAAGVAGTDGTQGSSGTSTFNFLPDFLTPLYTAISAFCSWLLSILSSVFMSLFTMIKDVVLWSFDEFMLLLKAIINAIDLTPVTSLIPQFSIPADVAQILGRIGFSDCMALISGSIGIRLILQVIPFTRFGS